MPDDYNRCPRCRYAIPLADINIEQGAALCRNCGAVTPLIELAGAASAGSGSAIPTSPTPIFIMGEHHSDPPAVDPPPSGCTLETGPMGDIVLTASARSLPMALFMGFFSLIWNGVTWTFVILVVSTLLVHSGLAPASLQSNPPNIPLPLALIMAFFITPFVLIGLFVLGLFFMALAGRVQVTIDRDAGTVFTGVGSIGRRQRFNALAITSVRLYHAAPGRNGQNSHAVEINGARRIRFGSMLSAQRAAWLCVATRIILAPLAPDNAR
jgi:hypothetical protein